MHCSIAKPTRWERFIQGVELDFRLFFFMLLISCVFRISFIILMRDYISDTATNQDVWRALFYGFRISLKSAGAMGLLTFLFCTVTGTLLHKDFSRLRLYLGFICCIILSFLFFTRIPYYSIFNSTFNYMIFNAVHEDFYALVETALKQYQLLPRSIGVLAIASLLGYLLQRIMVLPGNLFSRFIEVQQAHTIVFRTAFCAGLIIFATFIRFGGSLTFAHSIHWENSAVTRDNLLNEAILDDVQAVYRAFSQKRQAQAAASLNVNPESINIYGAILAGKTIKADSINQYLKKEANGPVIPKPKHIFFIIGESYANWPLWPQYEQLNIANGLKRIIKQDDSLYVPTFLPTGSETISSTNGIITGLAEVGLVPNYRQESYKGAYETALAPQMRRLGYETHFWYGGFYSWQRLRDFALAQGFQHFHAANEFVQKEGNAWGAADSILFNEIQSQFSNQQPSVHVILTTSNHPPYTVDIEKDGFDPATIGGLPAKIKSDGKRLTELGHFWYADKHIAAFVNAMRQSYPDTLFIITADHSNRMSLEANPDVFTRHSIPLVLHGQGVHKELLSSQVVGTQLDILPTVIELIAPKGFIYYSMGNSLTFGQTSAANHELWLTHDAIGKTSSRTGEQHLFASSANVSISSDVLQTLEARRALSWWRIMRGNRFLGAER